jgi:hypothetical protein
VAGQRHPEVDSTKVPPVTNYWSGPNRLFEFDPFSNKFTMLAQPPTATGDTWNARLLLLPTGDVMFTNATNQVYLYTYDGSWDPAWKPTILNWNQHWLVAGRTYTVEGTQLNGLSQAVSYGDDYTAATNYPLVHLGLYNTHDAYYCRTSNFSTMGVATKDTKHSFQFEVPSTITETGPAVLQIIVNGISADLIPLSVVRPSRKSLLKALRNQHIIFPTSIRPILSSAFGLSPPISITELIARLGNGEV